MSDSPVLLLSRQQSFHLHMTANFDCVPSVPFNGNNGILQVYLSPNSGLWISLLKFQEPQRAPGSSHHQREGLGSLGTQT